MIKKTIKISIIIVFLGQILLLIGCAANASRMVPENIQIAKKQPYSLSVSESVGGRETHLLWTSQISNLAYTQALTEALTQSGLFSQVIQGEEADYILDVTILHYDQPWIGADIDIKMKAKWELTDTKTLTPVWSETFETTYRAKLTDALIGAERLKKANEGSARVNIAEGIKRLSMIEL